MSGLIKSLISIALNVKDYLVFYRKARKIYKNLKSNGLLLPFSKDLMKKHLNYWREFGPGISNRYYKIFSSVYGKEDPLFVPEVIYYTQLEPKLNNRMMSLAYADKNSYDLTFRNLSVLPKTFFRKIEGVYYDRDYNLFIPSERKLNDLIAKGAKVIVKKTFDTGGGINVGLYLFSGGKFYNSINNQLATLESFREIYGCNFVVQEYIKQHNFYKRFNPSSLNTIRIFTYRSVINNIIIPYQAVFRIGQPGKFVDNQASGGISCGINKLGIINEYAVDKYGNKFYESNGIKFKDIGKAYLIDEMKEIASGIAQGQFFSRLIGFDFCVDFQENVKLLEINNSHIETNFLQMNNGPLFGEYTNEIVKFCITNTKSISLDFRI